MLLWFARRRARILRVEAEAKAMIHDLGDHAVSEARRREREASSDEIGRVALAVARMTGKRVGVEKATRMPE